MSHYEWNLKSSNCYRMIYFILWTLFLLVIYSYIANGYLLYGFVIGCISAGLLYPTYFFQKPHLISFHGGVWNIQDRFYQRLQVIWSNQYWFVIRAQVHQQSSHRTFVIFTDQLTSEEQHEFRWVMKLMFEKNHLLKP